jgi:hypothetical protein
MKRDQHLADARAAPDRTLGAWRAGRLREAGFSDSLAEHLGHDCGFDLHALIELVEQGCPPHLAARILEPLDQKRRPC